MADYRIFTYDEYLKLGVDGPWTPPFALENRSPLDKGGEGNYYSTRKSFTDAMLGGCIHITAGITDLLGADTSAENTVSNWGRITDYNASWTGIVDSDSIINSLHPSRTAWTQGVKGYTFNQPIVGLEIGKKETDWTTASVPTVWVEATLRNAAAYFAPYVVKYDWPMEMVTDRDEIQKMIDKREAFGFTFHYVLDPARKTDPGLNGTEDTFPTELFFKFLKARVAELKGKTAKDPGEGVAKGDTFEIVVDRMNTRVEPSNKSGIVGQAPKGTKLVATGNVSGPWIEAASPYQLEREFSSWWYSAYLKFVESAPVVELDPAELPVLKNGSKGDDVKALQEFFLSDLKSHATKIKESGGADGSFGDGTEESVKSYQRSKKVKADGVVGRTTWGRLISDGFTK